MKADKNSLRQQTLTSILWNGLSRISRQGLSILITIVLLRLLLPEDFGLLALVMLFIGLSKMLIEYGFSAIIIQRENLEQKDLSSIFWFCLINGGLLMALVYSLAKPLSVYFGEPLLLKLIRYLSLLLLLFAIYIVPRALFEKKFKFKFLAKVEVISVLASGLIAILMARQGFGVFSLIVQQLCYALLSLILVWIYSSWRPDFYLNLKRIRGFLQLGTSLFSNYFLAFIADNLDDFLIGKHLGTYNLGLYNKAFMVIALPVNLIAQSLGQVMLASFSKIQQDKKKLGEIYLMMNRIVVLFTFPLMIILYFQAPIIIPLVLGSQWVDMVPLFQVFCAISVLATISALLGPLIIAQGQSDLIWRDGLIQKSIIIFSIIVGIQWGLSGVILGRLFAEIINLFITFYHAERSIQINIWTQLNNLRELILLNGGLAIALLLLFHQFESPLALLILSALFTLALYWFSLHFFQIRAYQDLVKIINSANPKG